MQYFVSVLLVSHLVSHQFVGWLSSPRVFLHLNSCIQLQTLERRQRWRGKLLWMVARQFPRTPDLCSTRNNIHSLGVVVAVDYGHYRHKSPEVAKLQNPNESKEYPLRDQKEFARVRKDILLAENVLGR